MRKSLSILLIAWSLTSSAQMMLPAYQGAFSRKITASGVASNGLSFDGVNDYVSVSSDAKLNITANLTLSAWIYRNATGKDDCIIGKDIWASNNGYSLWVYNDNRLTLRFGNNSRTYQSNTTIPSGKWTHVAATFDGTNAKLYIDGTLSTTTAALAPSSNSGLLYLGTPQDAVGNSAYNFSGILDDVRIWNIALTQTQIQANLNTELLGTETGLVAYYNFNQGMAAGNNTAITTVTDKTANALNGTLTNFTKTGATSNFVVGKVETPIITNGLVLNLDASNTASYPGSGSIWTDISGLGNNGTLINSPTYNSSNGGNFVFNGSNTYVNVTLTKTASCTFSSWAKSSAIPTESMLFNAGNNGSGPDLFLSYGIISWNTWDSNNNPFGNIPATAGDGKWHYYVVVNDAVSNTTKLYYDGVIYGANATYRSAAATTTLYIGGNNMAYMWNGAIANFYVYNRSLIASEVLQNYNAQKVRFGL